MKFYRPYSIITLALLAIEFIIGHYFHDAIIRPFGGDFLLVILIYCSVRSLFKLAVLKTAFGVLLFAYAVEVSQYFHLVTLLGWQQNRLAVLLLGTTFSFTDLLMYTLGIAVTIGFEYTQYPLKNETVCR